ncbi:MAG: D-amino-acid dehydrogenase [Verrucomicrobia bacterium]|nr:MAG: D-amino-acid dehydrogenase [Verrucomicrobiota bacterium]
MPPRHTLIIGSGVIGLSTAHYCQQRGHAVTIIDRLPAQRDGCSFGNAGMIVPSHFIPLAAPGMVKLGLKWMWNPESPFYIKPRLSWDLITWGFRFWQAANKQHVARCAPLLRDLNFASRACYESLAAEGHEFSLVQKGLAMLCKTDHALHEEAATAARANELGIPAEVLDARAMAALDPTVSMDINGAVYFSRDCHLSPARFMASLEASLVAGGATFIRDTEVSAFASDGSRITAVQTYNGDFSADEIVVAGGSWSPTLAAALGLRLPMQAGKGYSLTVTNPRELPQLCSIFTEARVAVTPMDGALRFGGTMEIAGLNENITPRRVNGIIKAAPKYFPAFRESDFDGILPWRGLRPCSPDGMPYMGRTSRWKNVTIATGHSMMGLSLGPGTGKLIAEVVDGAKPSIDLSLLSPDRYA